MKTWNSFNRPPVWALKTIQAGRLRGKSDINPQWRYQAMTEVFGMCGQGWKYEIVRLWTEAANEGQVFAFAEIKLYTKQDDKWSDPIPSTGGSMLIDKEQKGLYANDEAYKMAITDALGTAMKMLGVAADVYLGLWDGSKYRDGAAMPQQQMTNHNEDVPLRPGLQDTAAANTSSLTEGKIEAVTVSSGINKKTNKEWHKYAVTLIGGDKFTTFDKKIAEIAKAAKEDDMVISISYSSGQWGNEIIALTVPAGQ